jgi:hypothetical protein
MQDYRIEGGFLTVGVTMSIGGRRYVFFDDLDAHEGPSARPPMRFITAKAGLPPPAESGG